MSDSPAAKRVKFSKKGPTTHEDLVKLAHKAWEHYRNYVESVEAAAGMFGADGEGDLDELEELLDSVLKPHMEDGKIQPLEAFQNLLGSASAPTAAATAKNTVTMEAMLPILISVVYYHLADVAIAECLEFQEEKKEEEAISDEPKPTKQQLIAKCQQLMEQSLRWYPENAAMWSMGANFARMMKIATSATVCRWYGHAVDCAVQVQQAALAFLELDQDTAEDSPQDVAKEWVELLLLNQVCAIDYVVPEAEEEEDDDEGGDKKQVRKDNKAKPKEDPEEVDEDDDKGFFSSSAVEATSRFMAAMLLSIAGKQDRARQQLEHFPLTHRIHPHVWQPPTTAENAQDSLLAQYKGADGLLPAPLYQQICKVFSPKAAYWLESDYNHRGYYSFFHDMPPQQKNRESSFAVTNAIDDVIWNHLYQLVLKQQEKTGSKDKICGAEWWVHTRPVQANLGHNLHFDTDEAMLAQEGLITHPVFSSVLYLTGGDAGGGSTIVLDQTPDAEEVASKAWRCAPKDNSLLVFPGNLLHGVLPCPGASKGDDDDDDDDESKADQDMSSHCLAQAISKQWIPSEDKEKQQEEQPHRLTLLVGYWSRRVPDKMKSRRLYGPCGPLPPRPGQDAKPSEKKANRDDDDGQDDDEEDEMVHTWVNEIHQGYDHNKHQELHPPMPVASSPLPVISPAWETINNGVVSEDQDKRKFLEIPKAIDHRFFVRDAPKCFRESLFEKEEDQDEGDDESYEIEVVEMADMVPDHQEEEEEEN